MPVDFSRPGWHGGWRADPNQGRDEGEGDQKREQHLLTKRFRPGREERNAQGWPLLFWSATPAAGRGATAYVRPLRVRARVAATTMTMNALAKPGPLAGGRDSKRPDKPPGRFSTTSGNLERGLGRPSTTRRPQTSGSISVATETAHDRKLTRAADFVSSQPEPTADGRDRPFANACSGDSSGKPPLYCGPRIKPSAKAPAAWRYSPQSAAPHLSSGVALTLACLQ